MCGMGNRYSEMNVLFAVFVFRFSRLRPRNGFLNALAEMSHSGGNEERTLFGRNYYIPTVVVPETGDDPFSNLGRELDIALQEEPNRTMFSFLFSIAHSPLPSSVATTHNNARPLCPNRLGSDRMTTLTSTHLRPDPFPNRNSITH
jgi:hypothetical protein